MEDTLKLVGVDQFGRTVESVEGYTDKKVGMFFWLWIGQPLASGAYDATAITKMDNGREILYFQDNKEISPSGQAHFWGKPLWGYYNSADEWVLSKQLEMLESAGIDFLLFDATNEVTYPAVYQRLMKIVQQRVEAGFNPPRVGFYTHTHSIKTTRVLYNELYSKNLYPDSWYRVDGKPFIVAFTSPEADIDAEEITVRRRTGYDPGPLEPEIRDFFYFRTPQWPCSPYKEDGFAWVEWTFPQPVHGDMINVTVASHPNVPMSFSHTRGLLNFGRGYDPDTQTNIREDCEKGTFFQREWDVALASDVKTVFVGGWNEWIAYKQLYDGEYMLCDAADLEYSRDIEPMEGGYEDAFYLQLIRNVRAFKGIKGDSRPARRNIDINSADPAQWEGSEQYNKIGPEIERNSTGCCAQIVYQQPAPLNCIKKVNVADDGKKAYFRIETQYALKDSDKGFMNVYLGTGTPSEKGFYSYSHVIRPIDGKFMLCTLDANNCETPIAEAEAARSGNVLNLSISLSELGNDFDRIYFKVWDCPGLSKNIMDSYLKGSALPMGRLSCEYKLSK